MSHFTVLVIGENPEEQLAPYSEQDKKYMKFVDKTDEATEEYKTETTSEFYCGSSSSWGMQITQEFFDKLATMEAGNTTEYVVKKECGLSYFRLYTKYKCYYPLEDGKRCEESQWIKVISIDYTDHPNKDVCFSGRITVEKINPPKEIPVSEKYLNFDDYVENYHGYEKEGDKYGYYSNENAKWDWYQLGGRWTEYFKLKSGAKGKIGSPGIMTENTEFGTVDQAFKKDIDFDRMYEENLEKAIETYDKFEKLLKENPEKAKNSAYWEFGIQNEGDKDNWIPESREKYLTRNASISTFAVVKDGQWYEKGEMGWWACVSNEKDPNEWNLEFKKLIDEISEDTLMSLYDCHI
jgi:hypothetical protein